MLFRSQYLPVQWRLFPCRSRSFDATAHLCAEHAGDNHNNMLTTQDGIQQSTAGKTIPSDTLRQKCHGTAVLKSRAFVGARFVECLLRVTKRFGEIFPFGCCTALCSLCVAARFVLQAFGESHAFGSHVVRIAFESCVFIAATTPMQNQSQAGHHHGQEKEMLSTNH